MLTGALVSGLAGMLVSIVITEEAVEANHRRGVEALYAADGLLTTVIAELTQAPDWHSVLDGSRRSSLRDGPSRVSLADGSAIDAEEETQRLQRQIARSSGTAVLPLWRLFAWGWFADLVGEPDQPRLLYVAAWVRDDWADPDADPELDTNGRVVVRAAAFGPFRTHRVVEATVAGDGGAIRVAAWGLVR